jgi:hypothetical protein
MSERFGIPDHAPQHAPDHAPLGPTPGGSAGGGGWDWAQPGGNDGGWSQPTSSRGGQPRYSAPSIGHGWPLPKSKRSLILAAILATVIGPFGLFYVNIWNGIAALMILPSFMSTLNEWVIGATGLELSRSAKLGIVWGIGILWAIIAMKIRNARIDRAA